MMWLTLILTSFSAGWFAWETGYRRGKRDGYLRGHQRGWADHADTINPFSEAGPLEETGE